MTPTIRRSATPLPVLALAALPQYRLRRLRDKFLANHEPRLGELMADPIVRCLLASDGVAVTTLQGLLSDVRDRLVRREMAGYTGSR